MGQIGEEEDQVTVFEPLEDPFAQPVPETQEPASTPTPERVEEPVKVPA